MRLAQAAALNAERPKGYVGNDLRIDHGYAPRRSNESLRGKFQRFTGEALRPLRRHDRT
jgi:hypothetical protein